MKQLTYSGWLSAHSHGESDDVLFLSSVYEPLVEELKYDIANKEVSVRYWIVDKECTKEQAQEVS